MSPDTRGWVAKAEEDFVSASCLMETRGKRVSDTICFLCQQAVEKYLKARLQEAQLPIAKTHDLGRLLDALQTVEPLWQSYHPSLGDLTTYAVDFRYPGQNATRVQARKALRICAAFRTEARQVLGLRK